MADLPKRKPLRLQQYDYSTPGAYFVTICTQDRRCILSEIRRGDPCGRPSLTLSPYGEIVAACIKHAAELYDVQISPFVIMPNHIHFICTMTPPRATARVAPTLGRIVGALKSLSANQCRDMGLKGKLWQRSYHEHVIRGEADYREIWEYIDANPAKWAEDRYYTEGINAKDAAKLQRPLYLVWAGALGWLLCDLAHTARSVKSAGLVPGGSHCPNPARYRSDRLRPGR